MAISDPSVRVQCDHCNHEVEVYLLEQEPGDLAAYLLKEESASYLVCDKPIEAVKSKLPGWKVEEHDVICHDCLEEMDNPNEQTRTLSPMVDQSNPRPV